MWLDHLLSKENSSDFERHPSFGSTTPSWCTVGSVVAACSSRFASVHVSPADFVFSSVLREFSLSGANRPHVGAMWHQSGSIRTRSSLRTAEQARASCFLSYKEPTVDALAPRTDEGRGRLRKATGSCLPSFDPWMSEWGNPALVMECHSGLNT